MKSISLFLFGSMFLVGCTSDQVLCDDERLTYDGVIGNIIEVSCNNGSCHPGSEGGWFVLPAFSTYQEILPFLESDRFVERLNPQDSNLLMPPPFVEERTISAADKTLLNDWIGRGFPENCPN